MPKSSSSRVSAPKTSSTAAFSASSQPTNSSILKTAFSSGDLELPLFASTIRSLDSERLRIHDTLTCELKSEHTVTGTTINCIRWGSYGRRNLNEPSRKKKRKLEDGSSLDANGSFSVIAVGTGRPDIDLFSPLEGRVLGTLRNAHDRGTRDFVFENLQNAWSLGTDGSLAQWNLETLAKVQSLESPAASITRLIIFSSSLLLGSQSAYIYNPMNLEIKTIPCFTTPIHTLISQPSTKQSAPSYFVAAAESTSTIGVYSSETLDITGNLNARSPPRTVSVYSQGKISLLCSASETGHVEIFDSPFQNWSNTSGDDLKTKRKKTTRRPQATIQVRRSDDSTDISPVVDVTIDSHGTLVIALVENSINVGFERIQLLNESGALVIQDVETVLRRKVANRANESADWNTNTQRAHVNDAMAVVGDGTLETENVTDEMDQEEAGSSGDDREEADATLSPIIPKVNGIQHADTEMRDIQEITDDQEEAAGEEAEEPTFGDLIKARGISTVEVSNSRALEAIPGTSGSLSSNLTLATLLTQALNTNDSASLDTCLAQQDLQVIRATIERLDSGLALALLHRLAERLHRRPGRAGSLLVWVQWTIVSHGGYLSSRPDTVQKLRSLHKVVQERAKSLEPLLALKGKLDMLDAQITFRKRLHQTHMALAGPTSRPEDMIYIEGQSESDTDTDQAQTEDGQGDEDAEEADDEDEDEALQMMTQEEDDDSQAGSEDADSASDGNISQDDDEIYGEVDHDDVDPEDSDTSSSAFASSSRPTTNGTKP